MKRRSFLKMLGGLPFISVLVDKKPECIIQKAIISSRTYPYPITKRVTMFLTNPITNDKDWVFEEWSNMVDRTCWSEYVKK